MESGAKVTPTVADQTKRVASEAADSLRALADQLDDMRSTTDDSGIAPEMMRHVAGQVRSAVSWLDDRRPGELVEQVRGFARRKPGMFLAGAALAGVLVGRLTRGVVSAQSDEPEEDKKAVPRQRRAPQPVGAHDHPTRPIDRQLIEQQLPQSLPMQPVQGPPPPEDEQDAAEEIKS
jgi:hypothetical protein